MPKPQLWRVQAVITPDGLPIVVLEFPDGNYVCDRDTAMTFGLSVVAVAMRFFPANELARRLNCEVLFTGLRRLSQNFVRHFTSKWKRSRHQDWTCTARSSHVRP